MDADGCFTCLNTADPAAPVRERVLRTGHWRAAHAFDAGIPGWLILAPLEHVRSLDELEPAAAAELGTLLSELTRALKAVTGCEKTYVMLLAEKEGFAHLHFHVVPRAGDLAAELRGPAVFDLLGLSEERRVSPATQDEIALRLQDVLSSARRPR